MNLMNDSNSSEQGELLFVNFNQDNGCFACGTSNGFIIYNVDPFRETFRRIFPHGGIGIIEMLYRCNLLAFVGGGRNPRYPTYKVMIWNDHENKTIGELKFRTEVKAVRLRRDRIIAVLESKVFVYRFKDLKLLDQITTILNPRGLVSLCPEAKNNVLAVPGLAKGSIRIELYDIGKATLIKAHDTELAQFSLNYDGSRIASASEKGTLIRIWNCHTGEPLRELRRGVDRADIYCISFNQTSTFVACSSDKGTVHIFSLASNQANPSKPPAGETIDSSSAALEAPLPHSSSIGSASLPPNPPPSYSAAEATANNKNMTGMGNFLKGFLPVGLVPKYFESEWSFGQVRGIEGRSICAFSKDSTKVYIISSDGQFIVANVEEGECNRVSTTRFLKTSDEGNNEEDIAWNTTGGLPTSNLANPSSAKV